MHTDNLQTHNNTASPTAPDRDDENRRELVRKLGKFAVYAAPFTVLALKGKAAGGSGTGCLGCKTRHP